MGMHGGHSSSNQDAGFKTSMFQSSMDFQLVHLLYIKSLRQKHQM